MKRVYTLRERVQSFQVVSMLFRLRFRQITVSGLSLLIWLEFAHIQPEDQRLCVHFGCHELPKFPKADRTFATLQLEQQYCIMRTHSSSIVLKAFLLERCTRSCS